MLAPAAAVSCLCGWLVRRHPDARASFRPGACRCCPGAGGRVLRRAWREPGLLGATVSGASRAARRCRGEGELPPRACQCCPASCAGTRTSCCPADQPGLELLGAMVSRGASRAGRQAGREGEPAARCCCCCAVAGADLPADSWTTAASRGVTVGLPGLLEDASSSCHPPRPGRRDCAAEQPAAAATRARPTPGPGGATGSAGTAAALLSHRLCPWRTVQPSVWTLTRRLYLCRGTDAAGKSLAVVFSEMHSLTPILPGRCCGPDRRPAQSPATVSLS